MFAQVRTCAAAIRARCRTFRAPQKFSSRLPCSNVPKGYLILASNTVDLSLHVLDFVQTEGYTVDSRGGFFSPTPRPWGSSLLGRQWDCITQPMFPFSSWSFAVWGCYEWRIGSCDYGSVVNPKSGGEAGRLDSQGRADAAVWVWRGFAGRIPSSLEEVSLFLRAFNWLDEARLYHGAQYALFIVYWFKC